MEQGIAPFIHMVKEAELFFWWDEIYLIFEYGDGQASNIGIATINHGQLASGRPFYTALDDGSEHVSTMGELINIGGGDILFFNRRREMEWGITWMIPDLSKPNSEWEVNPNWVIRAPRDQGLGPKGQLIAFGSCVYRNPSDPKQLVVLYHVNDNSCWYAILEFTG